MTKEQFWSWRLKPFFEAWFKSRGIHKRPLWMSDKYLMKISDEMFKAYLLLKSRIPDMEIVDRRDGSLTDDHISLHLFLSNGQIKVTLTVGLDNDHSIHYGSIFWEQMMLGEGILYELDKKDFSSLEEGINELMDSFLFISDIIDGLNVDRFALNNITAESLNEMVDMLTFGDDYDSKYIVPLAYIHKLLNEFEKPTHVSNNFFERLGTKVPVPLSLNENVVIIPKRAMKWEPVGEYKPLLVGNVDLRYISGDDLRDPRYDPTVLGVVTFKDRNNLYNLRTVRVEKPTKFKDILRENA